MNVLKPHLQTTITTLLATNVLASEVKSWCPDLVDGEILFRIAATFFPASQLPTLQCLLAHCGVYIAFQAAAWKLS